jgi:hypothetical protein
MLLRSDGLPQIIEHIRQTGYIGDNTSNQVEPVRLERLR